jgi:hypothetical protein
MQATFDVILVILGTSTIVCSYETSKLRILKSQLKNGIQLQCPLIGLPNYPNQLIPTNKIIWIDEKNQNSLMDKDMVIVNSIMLSQSSLYYNLRQQISDLSCGYYDQTFFRIKKWRLTYEDNSKAELVAKINSSLINSRKYNDTYTELDLISRENFNKITQSGKLMALSCVNNFDLPLTTARIWLNYMKYNQEKVVVVS